MQRYKELSSSGGESDGNIDIPFEIEKTLNELHKSFAILNQEEQKYANIFLRNTQVNSSKTFKEYVAQYQVNAEHSQIMCFEALESKIYFLSKLI